jgi:hypothetical protein
MNKLNTHFYDGKLKERYQEIQASIPQSEELPTLEVCYKEIFQLIREQKAKKGQTAAGVLNKLKSQTGNPANHDTRSNIRVDDLLPLVWYHVRGYDQSAKRLFVEQIAEMRGGMCPQGRVTRLIQMVELLSPPKKNN